MKKLIFAVFLFTLCLSLPLAFFGENTQVYALDSSQDLAPYSGKVYHIFFHSLILYPELAFRGYKSDGYNNWMTTRDEFQRILPKLYENNFVLVEINTVRQAQGKPFLFPKGKKPLIISIDDVNYYEYMKGDGFADCLCVDVEGNLATKVTYANRTFTDYKGDVVPIVESFVKKYPDFSFKGAKGIVAVTGYQGVFGYRTDSLQGAAYDMAFAQAKKVADTLKRKGWNIACHSYSHSNSFKDGSITLEKLKADINKWNAEVAPIVGKSNIFIAPYGTQFSAKDDRFRLLQASGFNVYCSVCKNMNTTFSDKCLISERMNFDGFTMLKYPSRITENFFDAGDIADRSRPAMT
jgi:peptidoglycan/xylan/chitin deacetylase (PgdA/CDA1 family)